MRLFALLWVAAGLQITKAQPLNDQKIPNGLQHLGVGYNILTGNPDGDKNIGDVDPGLLNTRRIFELTHKGKKMSVGQLYSIPDQVEYAARDAKVTTTSKQTFVGEKSYQKKLTKDISSEAGGGFGLFKFAFSLSKRSEDVRNETSKTNSVFSDEKTVHNFGRARYQYQLAKDRKYPVSEEFADAVCNLPHKYIGHKNWNSILTDGKYLQYMSFIDEWGTHVVTQVELGSKVIKRYRSTTTAFTKYALSKADTSVSVEGSYGAFSASLKVDVGKFEEHDSSQSNFGEESETIDLGSEAKPEPIKLTLSPLDDALDPAFYGEGGNISNEVNGNNNMVSDSKSVDVSEVEFDKIVNVKCHGIKTRRVSLKKALNDYPVYKGVSLPKDPDIRIPLTWPNGTYGLPMPDTGCPKDGIWQGGYRKHDTEDDDASNGWSTPNHFSSSPQLKDITENFCIKDRKELSKFDLPWQPGKYCIFQFDNKCPTGFKPGSIYWDDEDDDNKNNWGGEVPTGSYGSNTRIYYCCRTDGSPHEPIYLPTNSPFYLFRSAGSLYCQKVYGAKSSKEYLYWDTEDDDDKDSKTGVVPHSKIDHNIKIDYCYYTAK